MSEHTDASAIESNHHSPMGEGHPEMIDNPVLAVEPMTGVIGAEIRDLDVRAPIAPDVLDALHAAIARYGVVFLPGHAGDYDAHRNLARALGPINLPGKQLVSTLADQGYPEIAAITTETGHAKYANAWHTDVSWTPEPSKYSILQMQFGPAAGGDTMWCSQTAAYEALSPAMQSFLEPLTARHEIPGRSADHPVVIVHPVTGRRSLFVNARFTTRINELTASESRDVLDLLVRHATTPELTCRKRWRPGEFGIWDNQFVQHYAVLDYAERARRIHRIEIKGEAPIPARAARRKSRPTSSASS